MWHSSRRHREEFLALLSRAHVARYGRAGRSSDSGPSQHANDWEARAAVMAGLIEERLNAGIRRDNTDTCILSSTETDHEQTAATTTVSHAGRSESFVPLPVLSPPAGSALHRSAIRADARGLPGHRLRQRRLLVRRRYRLRPELLGSRQPDRAGRECGCAVDAAVLQRHAHLRQCRLRPAQRQLCAARCCSTR